MKRPLHWIPTELHSHTVHSDGTMVPATLAAEAHRAGFGALALTDHNTATGRPALTAEGENHGLVTVPGLELTTFFGHVLVWGAEPSVDWRTLGPSDLGPALGSLGHRSTLAIGAAHPFRGGNPFCTGCFWEYDLPFDDLDCLEVWSGVDPDLLVDNHRALALWDQLLNQGVRITATAGRDWHRADPVPGLRSATFVGVEGSDPTDFIQALHRGRAAPSLGPLPSLARGEAGIGDRWDAGSDAPLTFGVKNSGWGLALGSVEGPRVALVSNLGALATHALGPEGGSFEVPVADLGLRWARVEVRGLVEGRERLLAFTNPVYGASGL